VNHVFYLFSLSKEYPDPIPIKAEGYGLSKYCSITINKTLLLFRAFIFEISFYQLRHLSFYSDFLKFLS